MSDESEQDFPAWEEFLHNSHWESEYLHWDYYGDSYQIDSAFLQQRIDEKYSRAAQLFVAMRVQDSLRRVYVHNFHWKHNYKTSRYFSSNRVEYKRDPK